LRAPDDRRILNTVKVIDELLRVKLPHGPEWYRYNGDGYGEHDGSHIVFEAAQPTAPIRNAAAGMQLEGRFTAIERR